MNPINYRLGYDAIFAKIDTTKIDATNESSDPIFVIRFL